MSRWRITMIAGLVVLGIGWNANGLPTEKASSDVSTRSRLAQSAEQAYLDGIDGISGSTAAQAGFDRSADAWNALIETGVDDAAVWFNLGNAYLRGGRIGEAILAYRRGQRLSPTNDDLAANLAVARAKIVRPIEADANDLDFGDAAAGWRILSVEARWWLGIVAWIGFWVLLLIRKTVARRRDEEAESRSAFWRGGLLTTCVVAILCFTTVGLDAIAPNWRPVGVVIEPEVLVRSGNGDGFEAAIEEPITAGVEFRILEARPGWWRIELPDGSQGWIPTSDGARV